MQHKIPVAILGATGSVGQRFITLLADHPWFEIAALCASERSAGKTYKEAANWFQSKPLPSHIGDMIVTPCKPGVDARIAFSGLDSSVAGEIEIAFAEAGYTVVSNSKNHRMHPQVPLLIGDVNPDQLDLLKHQRFGKGHIITNPNCSTIGLVSALKPIYDQFGIDTVQVTTLQALSGAGYPGVSSLDMIDNVVPHIGGEEDKIETEPLKILGTTDGDQVTPADFKISAQCNRVPVIDGHLECVSIKLKNKATAEEIIEAWNSYRGEPQKKGLPTAPEQTVQYLHEENYPQPRHHRDLGNGMTVSVGRLRPCPVLDFKFVCLSHNTLRGAAGIAVLNAEILVERGFFNS